MSYIPTIIVNYDILIEHQEDIEEIYYENYNTDNDEYYASKTLLDILKYESYINFNILRLTLITTDTAHQNLVIREMLNDFLIQYSEWN